MSIISKWFEYLNEDLLTEGVADIGLEQDIVDQIRADLPDASEKGRVWIGNAFKTFVPGQFHSLKNAFTQRTIDQGQQILRGLHASGADKENRLRFHETYRNFRNAIMKGEVKTWKKALKSFTKQARSMGYSEEGLQMVRAFYLDLLQDSYAEFTGFNESIIITLNKNPGNYDDSILYVQTTEDKKGRSVREYTSLSKIPPNDWDYARKRCDYYLEEVEDPDQIIHTFEDGSFWYDLQTSQCDIEAVKMGHCGSDGRGELYSLRRKKGKGLSKPYVTISYNESSKTIFQIKGWGNACPPESLWEHIGWFCDNMGVETIQEEGEYVSDSEEVEKFQEMGEWLDRNTNASFDGGIGKKIEEMKERCEDYRNRFLASYSDRASLGELQVDEADWYDETPMAEWYDELIAICIELPFDFSKASNWIDNVYEGIADIFEEEDRSDIYNDEVDFVFIKANSPEQALGVVRGGITQDGADRSEGDTGFIVITNLDEAIREEFHNYHSNYEAYDYDNWLDLIIGAIKDAEDSVDAIEELLLEKGIIKPSGLDSYVLKAKDEFNNFIFSKAASKSYDVENSNKILFEINEKQAETLIDVLRVGVPGVIDGDRYVRARVGSSGVSAITSEGFKQKIIDELRKEEDEAISFAAKQIALDFGEKYEKEIKSRFGTELMQKLANSMSVGYEVVRNRKPYGVRYHIAFMFNDVTLPFFGPFVEYYDNNYEIIQKAFDRAVMDIINKRLKAYREEGGEETNLPLEERASRFDVRVYEMDFVMSYPLGEGFEMTDIHNIIRAIPNVTTIRTVGKTKRTQGNRTVSLQRLKFALQGQMSRREWVQQVLVPQVRKISQKIRLHRVDNPELSYSSKDLKESYTGLTPTQTPGRKTPRGSVMQVLEDWVQGGVMYDAPSETTLMRYHVMVPVSELREFMTREPRKHGHHFEAGYQKFIEDGPVNPVFVAVGKNGRVKITGNEDDLRYALKAGLEEVPVFFSYQRQV